MKFTNYIWLVVIGVSIVFLLNRYIPNPEPILIHGDTVTTFKDKEVIDSLTYVFESKLDSLSKLKRKIIYSHTSTHDTLIDTIYLSYGTLFSLGDSSLGVKGNISTDILKRDFTFTDIVFNNREKIKTVVDTLVYHTEDVNPFYLNEWFYTSIALMIALIGVAL